MAHGFGEAPNPEPTRPPSSIRTVRGGGRGVARIRAGPRVRPLRRKPRQHPPPPPQEGERRWTGRLSRSEGVSWGRETQGAVICPQRRPGRRSTRSVPRTRGGLRARPAAREAQEHLASGGRFPAPHVCPARPSRRKHAEVSPGHQGLAAGHGPRPDPKPGILEGLTRSATATLPANSG